MDIKTLELIIESAMADGILSEDERNYIYQKAKESNIPVNNVDSIIENITHKKTQSGFVVDEEKTNIAEDQDLKGDKENLSSGFIGAKPQNNLSSGFINNEELQTVTETSAPSTFFTNVELLSNQGAMSLVYKARRHNKIVIVKRIKTEHVNDKRYTNLFFKEFDNANQFIHPNIAQVYDKGHDEKGPFYYMEFVDGKPLSAFIKKEGLGDSEMAVRIMRQLCDALSYVHLRQVFHRDLKPDNILITYKGNNVKLIDFGLASADYFDDFLIKAGTPQYAAPEMQENASTADHRTDIYSLGLIFLEMLTGKTKLSAIQQVKNKTFAEIIKQCTAQKRDNRVDSCETLINLLSVSQKTEIVPDWLFEKIKEFCSDGKVSDAENTILLAQAKQSNIDLDTMNAYIELELQEAKEKINKEKQKKEELFKKKRNEDELKNEKEIASQQAKRKAQERLNQIKLRMGLPVEETPTDKPKAPKKEKTQQIKITEQNPQPENKPEKQNKPQDNTKKRRSKLFFLLAVLIIISPIVFFRPPSIVHFYENKIVKPIESKINEWFKKEETEKSESKIRYVSARNGLFLRNSKSTFGNTNIIGKYEIGTKVEIIEFGEEWCQVKVEGNIGFMATHYLSVSLE